MQNQKRVVIDAISPQINCGEFFIKRVVNEIVNIGAHVLVDGLDVIAASVLYKHENAKKWSEVRMQLIENDEWKASFVVEKQGFYSYKVQGWVDDTLNWQHEIDRKIDDDQDVKFELLEGINYLKSIYKKAKGDDKKYIKNCMDLFGNVKTYSKAIKEAKSEKLHYIFYNHPEKHLVNESKELQIYVDRPKARFSTWYEFFPRSASEVKGQHGTFKDCERLLPRVAQMGFDTLYFPPIHPINEVNRKEKNNTTKAKDGYVGSVLGIGSKDGGHKDVHLELGSIKDFKALIKEAKKHHIEIAMDYALQFSPNHPWLKSHPDWFQWQPEGTLKYAENPSRKHQDQDIVPIHWETKNYKKLWAACLDTILYWVDCGIHVFRVENPQMKPYNFWNWLISEVKQKHPDVLFLSGAYTRPKVMQRLAKDGFTQSCTYFTWRTTKSELAEYIEELTQTNQREYMQPSFWPNTPDINPYHLQGATESKYLQRYALAGMLSSSIGIYGPVFEHMLHEAIPGQEEYYESEEFYIKHYDWFKETKLTLLISKLNAIRHNNLALQQTNNIKICSIENDNLLAFYKWNQSRTNELLIVISLDQYYEQQGNVQLPLEALGVQNGQHIVVEDLVTGSSYNWHSEWNYVKLHPALPFHIFKIHK